MGVVTMHITKELAFWYIYSIFKTFVGTTTELV